MDSVEIFRKAFLSSKLGRGDWNKCTAADLLDMPMWTNPLTGATVIPARCFQCAGCNTLSYIGVPYKFCARCRITRYCSQKCQVKHWRSHRYDCPDKVAHSANEVVETLTSVMSQVQKSLIIDIFRWIRLGTQSFQITLSNRLAAKIIGGGRISYKAFNKGAKVEALQQVPILGHDEQSDYITKIRIMVEDSSSHWLVLYWLNSPLTQRLEFESVLRIDE